MLYDIFDIIIAFFDVLLVSFQVELGVIKIIFTEIIIFLGDVINQLIMDVAVLEINEKILFLC